MKEAYAKARGLGIALPFENIEVDLERGRVNTMGGTINEVQALEIREVALEGSTYVLAIVRLGRAAAMPLDYARI